MTSLVTWCPALFPFHRHTEQRLYCAQFGCPQKLVLSVLWLAGGGGGLQEAGDHPAARGGGVPGWLGGGGNQGGLEVGRGPCQAHRAGWEGRPQVPVGASCPQPAAWQRRDPGKPYPNLPCHGRRRPAIIVIEVIQNCQFWVRALPYIALHVHAMLGAKCWIKISLSICSNL